MSDDQLREWAHSLANIPACHPVRDGILRLLKEKGGPAHEDGRTAAAVKAAADIHDRVSGLEGARQAADRLAGELEQGRRLDARKIETAFNALSASVGAGKEEAARRADALERKLESVSLSLAAEVAGRAKDGAEFRRRLAALERPAAKKAAGKSARAKR